MEATTNSNKFKIAEGDWVCSDVHCGNINFARRNKCNRCGRGNISREEPSGDDSSDEEEITPIKKNRTEGPVTVKKKLGQEIGKVLADKSRGLFSADDWQCIKCGNVNWARRQQCNMCNAPKFGEVEERTGYGGGYNDRGVVEYIQRDESDSEYDEFGRKKKKKGQKDTESNNGHEEVPEKVVISKQQEGEEDEEEEEGDDDLSKYDLSDWGVNGDDTNQDEKDLTSRSDHINSRSINKTRRSRSRSPLKQM